MINESPYIIGISLVFTQYLFYVLRFLPDTTINVLVMSFFLGSRQVWQVPSLSLFFMTFIVLRSPGQIFCRMLFNFGLSNVFLLVRLRFWFSGKEDHRRSNVYASIREGENFPLPFLSSYDRSNNKIDTKSNKQEKKQFYTYTWEIINDARRNDWSRQLFILFRQRINLWRADRTKQLRFECSLGRNLNREVRVVN